MNHGGVKIYILSHILKDIFGVFRNPRCLFLLNAIQHIGNFFAVTIFI